MNTYTYKLNECKKLVLVLLFNNKRERVSRLENVDLMLPRTCPEFQCLRRSMGAADPDEL